MVPFLFDTIGYNQLNHPQKQQLTLHKKFPYLKFFMSVFSCIWTKYGDLLCKFSYSVQMTENTDQKNPKYGHFSRNGRN